MSRRLPAGVRVALVVTVATAASLGAAGCAHATPGARTAQTATRLSSSVAPSGATVQRWATADPALVDASAYPQQAGEMTTSVVLPAGYGSRRCWPVLYLLHGTQAGSQPAAAQWLTVGHRALERMRIPAIVVVPGSGDSWYVDNWFGGARRPAFGRWMLDDIAPLVARRLHVCPGRAQHSIAGLSMGAYGALVLAAQAPGYFGSAGSFSGPLAPQSANFRRYFNSGSDATWGPLGGFYAVGLDPTALVANLAHTRVFVGVGNGEPLHGQPDIAPLETEEAEFQQESLAWVARARAAGVPVTLDQHGGDHSDATWLSSLRGMLAWRPFAPVVTAPRDWTYATVAPAGAAWGWRFAFPADAPPSRVVSLTAHGSVLAVRGAGTVTLTTPSGHRLTGRIPFDVRDGRVVATPGAPAPHLAYVHQRVRPVVVALSPTQPSTTTPVQVRFTPSAPLPHGEEYQVGRVSFALTTGACSDNELVRIGGGSPGQPLTATLRPPASATFPDQWCQGRATFAVSEVPTGAPATVPGTILGTAELTIGN